MRRSDLPAKNDNAVIQEDRIIVLRGQASLLQVHTHIHLFEFRLWIRKNRSIAGKNTNFPEVSVSLECPAIDGRPFRLCLFYRGNIMNFKTTALLITSLLLLAGCDQAEKSAQQLMGKAAESAKQAIDDTHKAAEQAISDATGGLISKKESSDEDKRDTESSSQEI
ncbi:hypothetical protein PS862_00980 [Pseudomonas fluorescens]|uniref:Lipoprotein n=2 Tax=Pseudomonas fluorescens TaxID=294 RepID=A0A5E7HIH3_PSEFL|nr:hypothetical protein PS862_00980 [Pseudomonas fluorescens]